MDLDRARQFVQDHHRAVLATRRQKGGAQLSPVTVALDEEGRISISSRATAIKTKNLRRDPWASVLVLDDAFFGEWVQLDGRVEIVTLPDAMPLLVEYYRRVSGEHPDWDDYMEAMEREQRVMLRLNVERAGPDVSG